MTNTMLMLRTCTWDSLGLAPTQKSLQGTGLPFAGTGSAHRTYGDVAPAIDDAQVPPRDRSV